MEMKLEVEEDADDRSRKRLRMTAVFSDVALSSRERGDSSSRCSGHSLLTHCIDLPDQCGIAKLGEGDMELFLQHLYFASALHMRLGIPKRSWWRVPPAVLSH